MTRNMIMTIVTTIKVSRMPQWWRSVVGSVATCKIIQDGVLVWQDFQRLVHKVGHSIAIFRTLAMC